MSSLSYNSITTLISDREIECINMYSFDNITVTKKDETEYTVDNIFSSQEEYRLLIKEIIEKNDAKELSKFPVWKVSDKNSYSDYVLVITVSSPVVTETEEYCVVIQKISQ